MTTKTCTRCHQPRPVTDFSPKASARDGKHPYCRSCMAAAQRESRRKNPGYDREYYRKHPERRKGIMRVKRAIKQGRLAPLSTQACSMRGCQNQAQHYHHLDYSREARVAPVCVTCHAQIHSGDASERDLCNVTLLRMSNTGKKVT